MAQSKKVSSESARRVAEMRAVEVRRERRSRLLVIGIVAAVVLALAIPATLFFLEDARERDASIQAAQEPIDGVREEAGLDATHVENKPEPEPVNGTVLPPLGGEHDPVWQNCGVYSEPVGTSHAVHSLEHGAVWIAYHPGLSADQRAVLVDAADQWDYTVLSPIPDLASAVVLTAWGVQLQLDDVEDERLEVFLAKYVEGEQTPEPGAPCAEGIGTPEA
ncbi:MAG: DUF3105 domain-containing protein [Demequinaceae bacterium]|nr:DUF3105 domain-containing protein [Demequinaceae bacterium]